MSIDNLIDFVSAQIKDLEVQLNCSRQQLKEHQKQYSLIANVRPPVIELMSGLNQLRNDFCSLKDVTVSSLKSAADDVRIYFHNSLFVCVSILLPYSIRLLFAY